MPKKVYWLGHLSDACQLCERPYNGIMYDCSLPQNGMWANICQICFRKTGSALGVGRGQEYQRQKDGRWLKVKG